MISWLGDKRLRASRRDEVDDDPFPDTRLALKADSDAPGLLCAGGELSPGLLEAAYRRGIFPWYSPGQPVLWWAPDPRMVLRPEHFKLSRSLRKTIGRFQRTPGCAVRIDTAFDDVIAACSRTPRHGQDGTWIVPEVLDAYRAWHRRGCVHSVETWVDGQLVGGLYGVALGRMFFGESMFALQTDASKIAVAALVCFCRAHGIGLIDCQQRTGHLASLGAAEVPRTVFEARLRTLLAGGDIRHWTYDSALWAHLGTVLDGPPAPLQTAAARDQGR